ncbi:MAG: CDP-alcohol phosphatidyltransferase family protein [Gammaproteobacteria bacterium]|nr:MAG: CDP-alcohol phosphatidyltransferase family protein [Gammaproteobacteria bacterium]
MAHRLARHLPNLLTLFRMLLVWPLVEALLAGRYGRALSLFLLAGFTDGLDGFLARRYRWTSRLGGLLDPVADKLLMVSSFLALAAAGIIPGWLVWLVIGRDLVIVTGALAYHLLIEPLVAEPLLISKFNTLVQLLYVFAHLYDRGYAPLDPGWLQALQWGLVFTTLSSGLLYVWIWSRRAILKKKEGRGGEGAGS